MSRPTHIIGIIVTYDNGKMIEVTTTTNPVIEEVIEYLESWDIEPTIDLIRSTLIKWITNLYSHVGIAAHAHSSACGVENRTGISWLEQDIQMLKQIEEYKKCLEEIGG